MQMDAIYHSVVKSTSSYRKAAPTTRPGGKREICEPPVPLHSKLTPIHQYHIILPHKYFHFYKLRMFPVRITVVASNTIMFLVISHSPSWQMLGKYFELHHVCFLQHPFTFITINHLEI
jgi:hypothetical protein